MLSTLDRSIARQYLFNVLALVVLLFSFVVSIDVMLNLNEFMDRAAKIEAESGGGGGGAASSDPGASATASTAPASQPARSSPLRRGVLTALLIFDLWWPRLLQLFSYTIGLCLVGAMGFTFTQLVRHREVVAILAGGISLHRVLVPVMVVATLVMVVKVIDQELILSHPRIAPLLARTPADAGRRELANFQVPLMADGRGQIWFAREYEPSTGVLSGVEVWRRDSRGVVTDRISAISAKWRPGSVEGVGGGGGWELTGGRATSTALSKPGSGGAGRDEASAAPALVQTDLEPSTLLFRRFASYRESLSWVQIGQMLASPQIKPELREQLQRIRWGRVSMFLSSLLSLAITMPFFLMREPKNMLVQSLKCAPVGIVTIMGGTLLTALPIPGLPAGFAVFLPVLVLLPIAAAVLGSLRT